MLVAESFPVIQLVSNRFAGVNVTIIIQHLHRMLACLLCLSTIAHSLDLRCEQTRYLHFAATAAAACFPLSILTKRSFALPSADQALLRSNNTASHEATELDRRKDDYRNHGFHPAACCCKSGLSQYIATTIHGCLRSKCLFSSESKRYWLGCCIGLFPPNPNT